MRGGDVKIIKKMDKISVASIIFRAVEILPFKFRLCLPQHLDKKNKFKNDNLVLNQ